MVENRTDHEESSRSPRAIAHSIPENEGKVADYELNLFRNASLADIQFLFNHIDRTILDRVIKYLLDAPRVFIVGAGENHATAMFMSYRGSREFPDWYVLTPSDQCSKQLMKQAATGDVVFAISTCPSHDKNPYKDYTIQIAKRARDKGAKVVAIVDQTDQTLSAFANDVLFVPFHGEVLRSHVVSAVLIETIVGVTVIRSDF